MYQQQRQIYRKNVAYTDRLKFIFEINPMFTYNVRYFVDASEDAGVLCAHSWAQRQEIVCDPASLAACQESTCVTSLLLSNFLAFLCRVDFFPIVFAHMCQEKIFLNHFRFQHAQYFFDWEDCPLSLGKRGSNFANATGHQRS